MDADDPWSALDEELEKCLSAKQGKKGKQRDSLFSGSASKNEQAPIETRLIVRDEPQERTPNKTAHRVHVITYVTTPTVRTHPNPTEPPSAVFDEWSGLDEELAKLEGKGNGKGGKKDTNPFRNGKMNGSGSAQSDVKSTHQTPIAAPAPATAPNQPVKVPVPVSAPPSAVAAKRAEKEAATTSETSVVEASTSVPLDPETDDETFIDNNLHITGTCGDMCPETERSFRTAENELDFYERSPEASAAVSSEVSSSSLESQRTHQSAKRAIHATSVNLCVKKYTRIVDCPSPAVIRTKRALEKTTKHLYSLLGGKTDAPPAEWEGLISFGDEKKQTKNSATASGTSVDQPAPLSRRSNFLWDRLRGVRQDMSLQGFNDDWTIHLLEEMVRFAVAAEYLLCEDTERFKTALSTHTGYARATHNSHLHVEQLAKTLTTLTQCYRDRRIGLGCVAKETEDESNEANKKGDASTESTDANETDQKKLPSLQFPNEPEMRGYQLLMRMDTQGGALGRKTGGGEFLRDLRWAPRAVLQSPEIAFSLKVRAAYESGNVAKFFDLVKSKQCSFLQACCVHKYFPQIRKQALRVCVGVWNKTPVAVNVVGVEVLRLDTRFGEVQDTGGKKTEGDSGAIRKAVRDTATAMAVECGLTIAGGDLLPKETPFVNPADTSAAWVNRRERVIDKKAPTMKVRILFPKSLRLSAHTRLTFSFNYLRAVSSAGAR